MADAWEWGVWCHEDYAFCEGTIGTEEHAQRELPRWQSGEAAAVDPAHFHYEVRRLEWPFTKAPHSKMRPVD